MVSHVEGSDGGLAGIPSDASLPWEAVRTSHWLINRGNSGWAECDGFGFEPVVSVDADASALMVATAACSKVDAAATAADSISHPLAASSRRHCCQRCCQRCWRVMARLCSKFGLPLGERTVLVQTCASHEDSSVHYDAAGKVA